MEKIIDFLRRLDADNSREWFDLHRSEWSAIRERIAGYAAQLIGGIASFDGSVSGLTPRDCTYRIARDTRFSHDKRPYKNWVGIFVCPHGKKSGYAGYYLHIAPAGDPMLGGHMLVAGTYCPEGPVLRSLREEILDNGAELTAGMRAAHGFTLDVRNRLKRTPAGFPSGSEFDALLRQKDFCLCRNLTEAELTADGAIGRFVEAFRTTYPFVAQLNRAVQYAYEEMM